MDSDYRLQKVIINRSYQQYTGKKPYKSKSGIKQIYETQ